MLQAWIIKDRDTRNVLTDARSVTGRGKEYFEELINEDNEREQRVEEVTTLGKEVARVSKAEVRRALKRKSIKNLL